MISVIEAAYLLLGLVGGYVHGSFVESWCHDKIQHARRPSRDRNRRYPLVGKHLENAWKSHAVAHHGMTYAASHVDQFASSAHAARARAYFQEHALDPANDYGLTVTPAGFLKFLLPFTPVCTMVALVAPTLVSIPFCLMALLSPMLSRFVHPHLHRPYEEALATAPALVTLLLTGPLGEALWVRHFVHHRRPGVCFNLMLPIGDWLRGVHRTATEADLAEARQGGRTSEGPTKLGKPERRTVRSGS